MADKEATVYVVDVGSSMGQKRHGRDETDLGWSMRYIWDRITTTVATGRKTAKVGVVAFRTDGTSNELGHDDNFYHVSVLQQIDQMLMPNIRNLREKVKPSKTNDGDAISALVIAIQMILTHCKKLKCRRKIVLVTNGDGPTDVDGLDGIVDKLTDDGMELMVLGVDFDDPEYGFKEEGKPPVKSGNEQILKEVTEKAGGVLGTMAQAIAELGVPRIKKVNPVPSFRGRLTLGDPAGGDSIMNIHVERFPRTMVARAPSASSFVVRSDTLGAGGSTRSSWTLASRDAAVDDDAAAAAGSALTAVKSNRSYIVEDDGVTGGKREVPREDLAKGYEYGRTAVHISETDENVTKLETVAGLETIGFVPREKYQRYMNMSAACVVIAARANEEASMALSSFIHALYELDVYAVARLVTKDDKPPVMVLLAPSIEADHECLVDVQLPFAEDVRRFQFPPLDKILTVSGKVLTEHRNLPDAGLRQAMSDYVDRMDLSGLGRDDEGRPSEYAPLEDTYSAVLHRIDQAMRWRAVFPSKPIPAPYEVLTRYSHPPQTLQRKASSQLQRLIAAARIKKVPPKQKGRRRGRETVKPLSGLDVDALLGEQRHTKKISADNAVPEFKQLLATTQDADGIEDAARQMTKVIESQIRHSLVDSNYGRAVEALRVMREELTAYEEAHTYNDVVRGLKKKLLSDGLDGDRQEMWWLVRRYRLGLITHKESEVSTVTDEEAKTFLSGR